MGRDKQIRRQWPVGIVAVVVLALGGVVLTTVSVLPRVVRRNRKLLRASAARKYGYHGNSATDARIESSSSLARPSSRIRRNLCTRPVDTSSLIGSISAE